MIRVYPEVLHPLPSPDDDRRAWYGEPPECRAIELRRLIDARWYAIQSAALAVVLIQEIDALMGDAGRLHDHPSFMMSALEWRDDLARSYGERGASMVTTLALAGHDGSDG